MAQKIKIQSGQLLVESSDNSLDVNVGIKGSLTLDTAGVGTISTNPGESLTLSSDTSIILNVNSLNRLEINDGGAFLISGSAGSSGAILTSTGSGTAPSWKSPNTITDLVSSAGVINIDCSLGIYFAIELTEDITDITFSNLPSAGKGISLSVQITQGSGPWSINWPVSFKWPNGTVGNVSVGAGNIDLLTLSSFDQGSNWLTSLGNNYSVGA